MLYVCFFGWLVGWVFEFYFSFDFFFFFLKVGMRLERTSNEHESCVKMLKMFKYFYLKDSNGCLINS